jgi:peptidyl-prolyl cis-trans isomerase B (cyclophilin B)
MVLHLELVLSVGAAVLLSFMAPLAMAAEGSKPAASKKNPVVTIQTSLGTIKAELYPDKAPVTVKNFIEYARAGHYDGTVFHRVIPGFMIQGGGMDASLKEKPGTRAPIKNEAQNGLKNQVGTLAMARTNVVDSATSQFFINVKDNGFLDHKSPSPQGYGYAVFGKVTEGMDIVKKIEGVPTGSQGMHQDVPKTPVTIEKVTVAD